MRLRYAYFITCRAAVKNAAGEVTEVRLYDHLFTEATPGARGDMVDDLNPESLTVLRDCRLEPGLADAPPGAPVQFERQGYFCRDPDSTPERPVFNRTVALRDTWAKMQKKGG